MTVKTAPHRPTAGELDAAKAMQLPMSDQDVQAIFQLAHKADSQGQLAEAINVLQAAALARPDDWRIYEAFGGLYRGLGKDAEAEACFKEAKALLESTRSP